MITRIKFASILSRNLAFAFIIFSYCACDDGKADEKLTEGEVDFGGSGLSCEFDQDNDYSSARILRESQPIDGLICPIGDVDWYQLSLDRPGVLTVEVKMETALSPLGLTYEVYRIQDGETREIVAQPLAVESATSVKTQHCVASGEYGLRLSDQNNDAQDKRNLYELILNTSPEPDAAELEDEGPASGITPGDVPEGEIPEVQARTLVNGVESSGFIACRGDEDWFSIEVSERSILTWHLEMSLTTIQPQITLYSPSLERVITLNNASAVMNETSIERDISLTEPGVYYFKVEDMSGNKSDLDHPYSLMAQVNPNSDLNEPNNEASKATQIAISALECGDSWSPWIEVEGVIGTLGDIDWFVFETAGCSPGLIEVQLNLEADELSMSESFALQQRLELSVSLVESHEPTMCNHGENSADEGCRLLSKNCSNAWGCTGISRVCLPEGVCAGSTACLPNNRCASTKIERRYELPNNATELALPAHKVRLSAPLPSDARRYLRVSDYGGNSADPRATYTMKVRIRKEPDLNEPSNVYTDEVRRGDNVTDHINMARNRNVILVHDHSEGIYAPSIPDSEEKEAGEEMAGSEMAGSEMAGSEMAGSEMAGSEMAGSEMAGSEMAGSEMAGSEILMPVDGFLLTSCDSDQAIWTEGVISYEDDQDFYTYRHPCPGEDCMVKVYYEIDEGPVDLLWQVYQGDRLWFDPIVPVSELEVSGGLSGVFGGLNSGDRCFYAWQGNASDYTISIRDLRPKRDWSTEQKYRFCVEKSGNGCFEPPCVNQERGCSSPR